MEEKHGEVGISKTRQRGWGGNLRPWICLGGKDLCKSGPARPLTPVSKRWKTDSLMLVRDLWGWALEEVREKQLWGKGSQGKMSRRARDGRKRAVPAW